MKNDINNDCVALRKLVERLIEEKDAAHQALYETQRQLTAIQATSIPLMTLVCDEHNRSRKHRFGRMLWRHGRLKKNLRRYLIEIGAVQ